MSKDTDGQTADSTDTDVEPPQPGDLRPDIDRLFRVSLEGAFEFQNPVKSPATSALRSAGMRKMTIRVEEMVCVVFAADDDPETIRQAVLDQLEAETGDMWSIPDRDELAEVLALDDIEPVPCEIGCNHQAAVRNAPMNVNGRLFWGDLCHRCYCPPEELKQTFPEGSAEREQLERKALDPSQTQTSRPPDPTRLEGNPADCR